MLFKYARIFIHTIVSLISIQVLFYLTQDQGSCKDRCDTQGTDPSASCQCNKFCMQYGDCCSDYEDVCLSCAGRCGTSGHNDRLPCQCNSPCVNFGDCCEDYTALCGGAPVVTDDDLKRVSEQLWQADTNSFSESQYTVDRSGSRYFTYVDESLFSTRPTFAALVNLLDNYIPYTGTPEPNTAEHQREQAEFLEAVMQTQPMKILHEFLVEKELASSSISDFIEDLKQYWFLLFTRSGGPLDSSGFEHIFVGEIKNGVSGFHGWVNFYLEEQDGELTYTNDLGVCEPRVQRFSMRWLSNNKPISSMFVGVSPEYEFALYTLCFATRAGRFCPTVTDGRSGNIVSYTMSGVSPKTIGTVYPEC